MHEQSIIYYVRVNIFGNREFLKWNTKWTRLKCVNDPLHLKRIGVNLVTKYGHTILEPKRIWKYRFTSWEYQKEKKHKARDKTTKFNEFKEQKPRHQQYRWVGCFSLKTFRSEANRPSEIYTCTTSTLDCHAKLFNWQPEQTDNSSHVQERQPEKKIKQLSKKMNRSVIGSSQCGTTHSNPSHQRVAA